MHNEGTIPQNLFGKIMCAWEKVHVRENKLKRKDPSVKDSYIQWVKERVQLIKLPFEIDPTYLPDEPDLSPKSIEEDDRLKVTIAKFERDKESLEYIIYDMTYENRRPGVKKSWELSMWEQQERESALATQIHELERALVESQATVSR